MPITYQHRWKSLFFLYMAILTLPGMISATAVARGAVLRAFDKERGPRRFARSSYGVLRTEEWEAFPEHKDGGKRSYDRHDGQPYAVGTVDWVLKLVTLTTSIPLRFSRPHPPPHQD